MSINNFIKFQSKNFSAPKVVPLGPSCIKQLNRFRGGKKLNWKPADLKMLGISKLRYLHFAILALFNMISQNFQITFKTGFVLFDQPHHHPKDQPRLVIVHLLQHWIRYKTNKLNFLAKKFLSLKNVFENFSTQLGFVLLFRNISTIRKSKLRIILTRAKYFLNQSHWKKNLSAFNFLVWGSNPCLSRSFYQKLHYFYISNEFLREIFYASLA